jgi:hypothetical protein
MRTAYVFSITAVFSLLIVSCAGRKTNGQHDEKWPENDAVVDYHQDLENAYKQVRYWEEHEPSDRPGTTDSAAFGIWQVTIAEYADHCKALVIIASKSEERGEFQHEISSLIAKYGKSRYMESTYSLF